MDPPFTDQSKFMFFQHRDYLPPKDELSRKEIAPALDRLLDRERRSYRRIFALSVAGFVGLGGLALTQAKLER